MQKNPTQGIEIAGKPKRRSLFHPNCLSPQNQRCALFVEIIYFSAQIELSMDSLGRKRLVQEPQMLDQPGSAISTRLQVVTSYVGTSQDETDRAGAVPVSMQLDLIADPTIYITGKV